MSKINLVFKISYIIYIVVSVIYFIMHGLNIFNVLDTLSIEILKFEILLYGFIVSVLFFILINFNNNVTFVLKIISILIMCYLLYYLFCFDCFVTESNPNGLSLFSFVGVVFNKQIS